MKYNSYLAGDRDTLSFSFQYREYNCVTIERYYYNEKSFINYLNKIDDFSHYSYKNLRSNQIEVSFEELGSFLKEIQSCKGDDVFLYEISKLAFRCKNGEIDIPYEESANISRQQAKLIDRLNILFRFVEVSFKPEPRIIYNYDIETKIEHLVETIQQDLKTCNQKQPFFNKEILDDFYNYELRVFKVGQANCSALIKFADQCARDFEVIAIFDFGNANGGYNNISLNVLLKKITCKTVIIISHFHTDHINLISSKIKFKKCKWVLPIHNPKNHINNKYYINLMNFSFGNRYFFKGPYNLTHFLWINQRLSNIKIGRFQRSRINASCLISRISIRNKNVLIPGDTLYENFPKGVFGTIYNYILIPHHCCGYYSQFSLYSPYCSKISSIVNKQCTGIVLSGNRGIGYGHADTSHITWYKKYVYFDCTSFCSSKGNIDASFIPSSQPIIADYYSIIF